MKATFRRFEGIPFKTASALLLLLAGVYLLEKINWRTSFSSFEAGFYYYLENKPLPYVLCFACAILTRESAFLFILLLAIFELFKEKRIRTALRVSTSIIPYFLWKVY